MFDTLMKFDKNREVLDFYATDKRATKELLIRENFRETIYEPACGQGHIVKVLEEHGYKVKAEDICYRGYGSKREVDFFTVKENTLDIVTNPPYFCADKFLKHALEISVPKVKIAMLFRLAFLEGQKRYELFKKYPIKRYMYFPKGLIVLKMPSLKSIKAMPLHLHGLYGK